MDVRFRSQLDYVETRDLGIQIDSATHQLFGLGSSVSRASTGLAGNAANKPESKIFARRSEPDTLAEEEQIGVEDYLIGPALLTHSPHDCLVIRTHRPVSEQASGRLPRARRSHRPMPFRNFGTRIG